MHGPGIVARDSRPVNALVSAMLALFILTGCAFTAEDHATSPALATTPRTMNARALGYGVFLPSCVLFCVATGQASQAEHGDAQAGDLTTTASATPQAIVKPKRIKRLAIRKGVNK
jgi:hypothetical protein